MKENNHPVLNSRKKSIVTPVYTFFVIAIPSLIFWICFSNDFGLAEFFNMQISWWIKLIIAIVFVISTFLITLLCVWINFLDINVFLFSLPVSICFMVIFVSDDLSSWIRALVIIPFFFLIIPITILTRKFERKIKASKKIKNEKLHEQIVGYKGKNETKN